MTDATSNGRKTHIAYVLDKSGSMSVCRREAVEGTNRFLASIRDEHPHSPMTVVLFDTMIDIIANGMPVAELPDLPFEAYQPDGWTALYDAVGKTIEDVERVKEPDDHVLFAIFTDGMENSSVRFGQREVFRMIRERTDSGKWTFVFLGANQDSWASAEQIGIPRYNAVNFSQRRIADTMDKVGRMSAEYLCCLRAPDAAATTEFFAGRRHIDDVDVDESGRGGRKPRRLRDPAKPEGGPGKKA